jgi:hypothetical protein
MRAEFGRLRMKKKNRPIASLLAAAMLVSALPARASDSTNILFGLLAVLGITLGVAAYQTDYGKEPELKPRDETKDGPKKDGAHIRIVPPPASNDESRPTELAAGIAWTAKF